MTWRYRELEHTGDLRLEIRAFSWESLLKNAVTALTDSITTVQSVRALQTKNLELKAEDLSSLFIQLLKAILLYFETEGFLTQRLEIVACTAQELKAIAWGETYSPERHPLKTEIKAVTYHQLEVKRTWWGWRARVVLDV